MDGNYASPIMVNGYSCDNCAQVALAKKDINPAHPETGPSRPVDAPAVTFGGVLAGQCVDAPGGPAAASLPTVSNLSALNVFA